MSYTAYQEKYEQQIMKITTYCKTLLHAL